MSTTMTCPRRSEGPGYDKVDADSWRDDRTCSYCGSLHPDDFMALAAGGTMLDPTDKPYKVYVKGVTTNGSGKFYFQHLSAEQQRQFVDLLNSKTLNIGYPGHFYTRPFFIGIVAKDEGATP